MKLVRSLLWFAVSFAIAWIVIFTFIQPEFKIAVPAKIFTYQTQPYPVYSYVLGAFLIGIFFGFIFVVYNYFAGKAVLRKKNKELKDAHSEVDRLKGTVQTLQDRLDQSQEELTESRAKQKSRETRDQIGTEHTVAGPQPQESSSTPPDSENAEVE